MAPRTKRYNLEVRASEKGTAELKKVAQALDKTNRSLKRVQKSSKETSKTLLALRNTFNAFIAALGVREVARFSDEIQLLEDRLTVFANEGETGVEVLEQLNVVANDTRGDLVGLGEAYNRVSINVKDLGLNTQQLLTVTQALQQTFRLSGASTAETNSALIQFTQGLAQGELRGQELRSVLEANSIIGGLLADKLGSTRGELIKLGEAGKITSDVALSVLFENFKSLNEQADRLRPTFEQGVTKVLNELRLEMNRLNKEFDLSGNFFKGAEAIVENLDEIAAAATGLLAAGTIITLTKQVTKLAEVIATAGGLASAAGLAKLGARGGLVGLIAGGIVGAGVAAKNIPSFAESIKTVEDAQKRLDQLIKQQEVLAKRTTVDTSVLATLKRAFFGRDATPEKAVSDIRLLKDVSSEQEDVIRNITEQAKLLDLIQKKTSKGTGTGGLADKEVVKNLQFFNKQLAEGTIELEDYREAVLALEEAKLTDSFNEGKISIDQYNKSITKLREELEDTKEGTFSLVSAMKDGTEEYIKSAGTLAENISGMVSNTFKGLEDQIVEFVKTGKFEFSSLVDSILEDLLRIAVRQSITAPLAKGLFGALAGNASLSGGGGPIGGSTIAQTPSAGFAKGGGFNNGNLIPFATGGVVNGPTTFGMSGGRTGLMGEAGPEAIVPLSRGKGGKLGINGSGLGSNVTVNVINNGSATVETEENEGPNGDKVLDIIISQKVVEGIEQGKFDKSLSRTYGLRRQGF